MVGNVEGWCEVRKKEIQNDDKIADKADEIRKVNERAEKYRTRMAFTNELKLKCGQKK
jgi:hypothetical protein